MIQAYAAMKPGGPLEPFEYDPGPLGDHEVEIMVEHCGLCYSDLSMLDNEWGGTEYPFVPGHEVVGKVSKVGKHVANLVVGQRVGLGWHSGSCMSCECCISGNHNHCSSTQPTITSPHGAFADRVRARSEFVFALPEVLNAEAAGPLLCGGGTVFNPLVQHDIKPTDKVGVIGIGGLGHLALRFLNAWGCRVTAFSSTADKEAEARQFGATEFVNSRDSEAVAKVAGSFDYILSTVNAALDWSVYVNALRPKGKLIMVGVAMQPIEVGVASLIHGEKSIAGGSVGSPATIAKMLDFAAQHDISPVIEKFEFTQVNEALDRLRSGDARYRIVLSR